jgi:hypothetical protein
MFKPSKLEFQYLFDELFETKTKKEAFAMIEKAGPFLRSLEGARLQGGPSDNIFDNLFEFDLNSINYLKNQM